MPVEAADLPGVLAQIADLVGLPAALTLANEFGGTEIYVPANPRAGCRLARAVGLDIARRISTELGAGALLVPLGPAADGKRKRARIAALLTAGGSVREIARAVGVHERTVYRIAAATGRADPRQLDLLEK